MTIDEQGRRALIVALALRAKLGRTAVMKLMFFLQEIRGVSLDYDFRIYTYGPYDAQVLEDLRLTESQDGVATERVEWSGGSGVEITAGKRASAIISEEQSLIDKLSIDIDWVVSEFGKKSAADLEVLSTIVFIDRSLPRCLQKEAMASKVHALKPHHSLSKIYREIDSLNSGGHLTMLC